MPDRRTILTTLAALAAPSFAPSAQAQLTASLPSLPLWPGTPPGGGGPTGDLSTDADGAVANVATPVLHVVAAERPSGVAVLIAGGGGYRRISLVKEAYPAAYWLAAQGITAFVLTYRLPRESWNAGPIVSLQDGQRAMRTIRAEAARFRVDPKRVGVMGFSAGGHLAGLVAARYREETYARVDAVDDQPVRPDFASLIYPVVSLEPPFDGTQSRRSLVGESPTREESAAWSLHPHVKPGCPPIFLVQTDDDPVISPEQSRIFDDVCRQSDVAMEYHRFAIGGHGFGVGSSEASVALWPQMFRHWLASLAVMR